MTAGNRPAQKKRGGIPQTRRGEEKMKNYEEIAEKTGKEWAVIAAYNHVANGIELRAGDFISAHSSYELARRACKRSGFGNFRLVRNLRD